MAQSTLETPISSTKLQQNVDYKTIFPGVSREMAQEKSIQNSTGTGLLHSIKQAQRPGVLKLTKVLKIQTFPEISIHVLNVTQNQCPSGAYNGD